MHGCNANYIVCWWCSRTIFHGSVSYL